MRLLATSDAVTGAGASNPGMIMRRGGKNRNRRGRNNSGAGGTGSTAIATIPKTSTAVAVIPPKSTALVTVPKKVVKIPVTETVVKQSPELVTAAEETDLGETVGGIAGGVLDVWEGLETATDSGKSGVERGGGGAKAVGGATVLGTKGAKAGGLIGEATETMTGVVSEAMGFLSSAAECYAAVKGALETGAYDAMYALAGTIGPVVGGALKSAEAYAKYAEASETFKAWIGEGLIPGITIVSAAVKGLQKFLELSQLSQNRKQLMTKIASIRDATMVANSKHLVSLMDSKWYKGAIELVATLGELVGEFIKWSTAGVGTITGSILGAGSKLLPLGAKVFNYLWATANDWGGTAIWGGKTTAEIEGSTDDLADMIVARSNTVFGKLLCKVAGIDLAVANDKDEVMKALGAFG